LQIRSHVSKLGERSPGLELAILLRLHVETPRGLTDRESAPPALSSEESWERRGGREPTPRRGRAPVRNRLGAPKRKEE